MDGTVIDETFHPSARTVRAIADATAAGRQVIVATGRMFCSARRIAGELGVTAPLVCYQGALVGDPGSGEILSHDPLEVELARELLGALGDDARRSNLYVDDTLYVWEANDAALRYAATAGVELHAVGDLGAWLHEPTTKIVTVGDPAHLDGRRDELVARFGDRAYIAKSLPFFLEFAAPGISKASALAALAARLGFEAHEAVAVGDGENDREMLDWAGLGVAVANADEALMERADWVIPSVHEDGVAQLLDALGPPAV